MGHRINLAVFILGLALLFLFFRANEWYLVATLFWSVLFFIGLSSGVLFLRLGYFVKTTSKLSSNLVLLTFDDGPDEYTTATILDVLKEEQTAGVFFLIGEKAVKHPELVQRIIDEGHLIGNHTWSHPLFYAAMPSSKVAAEVDRWDREVSALFHLKTSLFRPPVGYTNPIIAKVLKQRNKKVIAWSKRSYDTVYKNPARLLTRMLRISKPGDIVLFHDNLPQTATMLSAYIRTKKQNGVIFAQAHELKSILNDF